MPLSAHRLVARLTVIGALCAASFVGGCASLSTPPPASIPIAARPNGLAVRPGDGALFVTDDRSNALLVSTDRATFAPYANVPAVPDQPNTLSEAVFAQPGVLLVARFGFGNAGGLFGITAAGAVAQLTGLAPQRRRIGLASLGAGRALSTWFVKTGAEAEAGGLSLVTYDTLTRAATERDLVVGLAKPVGVAVSGDTVFVSDQARGAILRYSVAALLAESAPATGGDVFVSIDAPDLLAVDAGGALYTKCHAHAVCRVAPDGTLAQLADDLQDARGVAVDDARHRLYVVDRAKGGGPSAIRSIGLAGR